MERAGGIAEVGRITHTGTGASWTPAVSRAVIVGDKVFTLSDLGMKANALAGFADRGWAAFPDPPDPECGDVPLPRPDGPAAGAPVPCPVPLPIP